MLAPLLEQLKGVEVILYDNGHDSPEGQALLAAQENVVDARGWPFYKMWNNAWEYSAERGYAAVGLLNDDIVLHPESLKIAFDALMGGSRIGIVGLNYERRVAEGADADLGLRFARGARRNHGIGGQAFLVKSSLWGVVPPIDEEYVIWFGDDDLFYSVEAAGYCLRVALGAPVDHEESTTLNQHPELLARTGEDAERFRRKFAQS
jgi:GT2 family glycosyltransferase